LHEWLRRRKIEGRKEMAPQSFEMIGFAEAIGSVPRAGAGHLAGDVAVI
jgi:hypothetical protein